MTGITSLAGAGHVPSLATQLLDVAATAGRAARAATGEYLLQGSRQMELTRSVNDARRATGALEALQPRIAVLDGGEDGLRLAKSALDELAAGRGTIVDGVGIEDDVVRSGAVAAPPTVTSDAARSFARAEASIRGIAEIATAESMPTDEFFRRLLAGG